ncbi:MAG: DUF6090 family protein [Pseudomonadota bacterium]
MLLRRFTQHVQDQNWFAVALDFAIVVIGVFIGIQVANWNEARAEKRLSQSYVDSLIADLGNDVENMRVLEAYYGDVVENIERSERLLREDNPDPATVVLSAYRATEIAYLPLSRATWDQVVSSGHLGLLPDGSIRTRLQDYYAFEQGVDINGTAISTGYRNLARKLIPISVQQAIRNSCSDQYGDKLTITGIPKIDDCILDVPEETLARVAELLINNEELSQELNLQYTTVLQFETFYAANVTTAAQLAESLEASAHP